MSGAEHFFHKKVIVKADDYGRGRSLYAWQRFMDVCAEFSCVPSIGVVTEDLDRASTKYVGYINGLSSVQMVELFDHSFDHSDFTQLGEADVEQQVLKSDRQFQKYFGCSPKVFGAPFNKLNSAIVDTLLKARPFDIIYGFSDPDKALKNAKEDTTLIPLSAIINAEISTQSKNPVQMDFFFRHYERARGHELIVLQCHPDYWTQECLANFRDMMHFLRYEGRNFVSASDYHAYRNMMRGGQPIALQDAASLLAFDERMTNHLSALVNSKEVEGENKHYIQFYFNRYRKGSLALRNQLIKLGFDSDFGKPGQPMNCIDIGCGSGNWVAAYESMSPHHTCVGVDINQRLIDQVVQGSQEVTGGAGLNLTVQSAVALNYPDRTFQHMICVNAFNYMPAERALTETRRVQRHGGYALLSIQNQYYPLLDGLRPLKLGDKPQASRRLRQLVDHLAAQTGISTQKNFWRTWTPEEMTALAMSCGYHVIQRDFDIDERNGYLAGKPLFSAYLLSASSVSLKRAQEQRSATNLSADHVGLLFAAGAHHAFHETFLNNQAAWARKDLLFKFIVNALYHLEAEPPLEPLLQQRGLWDEAQLLVLLAKNLSSLPPADEVAELAGEHVGPRTVHLFWSLLRKDYVGILGPADGAEGLLYNAIVTLAAIELDQEELAHHHLFKLAVLLHPQLPAAGTIEEHIATRYREDYIGLLHPGELVYAGEKWLKEYIEACRWAPAPASASAA